MNEAAGPSFLPFIMLLVFFLFIYFVTIRPQQKRQKEHEALVSSLEKGDEVMTSSGLIGKIDKIFQMSVIKHLYFWYSRRTLIYEEKDLSASIFFSSKIRPL